MGVPYDVHEVEARWRGEWERAGVGRIDLDDPSLTRGDVFYNLVEFPYPSGEGLHVGHVFRYCGADVLGRYQRMNGRRVFQPMGFDAFGINAENYALKEGRHPADHTARTVERFRAQLSRIGCAWDWSHSVDTSRPDYYRWTQWVLVKLFEAGLMYQAEAPVIWCPSCLTVLAREQTEGDGARCERCSTSVVEKVMTQWFLRTTAYRDRLAAGIDALDWTERAKKLQRHWLVGLHDWLISRQRYWGPPIPIVHCSGRCGAVAVPEDQLPVVLPHVDDVRPAGTGKSPLAAVEEWVRTTCPRCGGPARRETDVSDTFVDSSWYFLRYPSSDIDDEPWSDRRTAVTCPVDFYAGGPEHVQRHHLYARFVTMALHDLGLVPFEEPFPRVRLGGMIVHGGAKMSKSRGNVVRPDEYIDAHGSDVLRCALLFSAPWEQGGDFQLDAITGIERFFGRVWRAVTAAAGIEDEGPGLPVHVRDNVARAIERLHHNVAIARLMEAVRAANGRRAARELVLLLAPFAPHLAEELWAELGEPFSVHEAEWPSSNCNDETVNERRTGSAEVRNGRC